MKLFTFLFSLFCTVSVSHAATTVGIVDSGFFMEHELLKNNLWVNELETQNRIDDDRNGFVDDVYGWNFAENSRFLFDITQLDDIRPLTYRFMSIAAKMSAGLASEEELAFIQENLIDLPIPERNAWIAELNFYGQYAHGTHVAGLVLQSDPEAKIANFKFFPSAASPVRSQSRGFWENIQSTIFGVLATLTNQSFQLVGDYIGAKDIQVANMSLGIPMERLAGISLTLQGNTDPTEEELAAESQKVFAEFEKQALEWMSKAEGTLFIAASGNSGLNNDLIPAYPANVDHPNMISVGATVGYDSLPEYSNYGMSVDVVAPGTSVLSAAPGPQMNFEIEMTGTSMAAPFVAGVASGILSRNPELTPAQVKQILLETVDKKDWLEGKVATSGIVNKDRAYFAARMTLESSVDEAILQSMNTVQDVPSSPTNCFPEGFSCAERSMSSEAKSIVNQIFNLN
jgi:subtilisin family serine protease